MTTPTAKDLERARKALHRSLFTHDDTYAAGVHAFALALDEERETERLRMIGEIRSLGCAHGCVPPCPSHRQLDALPVRRAGDAA